MFDALDRERGTGEGGALTLEQLSRVPQGLYGTFEHYFESVWHKIDVREGADGAPAFKQRLLKLLGLLAVACREPTVAELVYWMGSAEVETSVRDLLADLGSLFIEGGEGGPVKGFHKSIYDWLLARDSIGCPVAAHRFTVDAEAAHRLLAVACCRLLVNKPLPLSSPPPQDEAVAAEVRVGEAYAKRYAVAHTCQPGGWDVLLNGLLLDFGAWHAVFNAGK